MSDGSLLDAFATLLKRDLILAMRRRAEIANPLLFFVLITSLFPLAIGDNQSVLRTVGPGIIWVAALLSVLLSLDGMFRSDHEDGSLEQLMLASHPLSLLVIAKVTGHWLVTGMPLLIVAPLLGILLALPGVAILVLLVTLLLGTPVLSLIGAVGVALTVGLRRGGIILSLLVLPLYVPVLIFSSNAVAMAATGIPVTAQLYMLGAILVLSLSLAPLATAASLRVSVS